MVIKFSVRNFKSFKEQAILNLIASNYDKNVLEEENIVNIDINNKSPEGLRLLKTAVVYGPNASGKTKLFEALSFMKHFTITSSKDSQAGEKIPVDPFRLNLESIEDSSEFEITFLNDRKIYRYGFETTKNEIVAEWLFYKENVKEVEIFYREGQIFETINKNKFKKGAMIAKANLVRENALFLSVAAQFNDEFAIEVINQFLTIKNVSGTEEESYSGYTLSKLEGKDHQRLIDFLQNADLNIEGIGIQKISESKDFPDEIEERERKVLSSILDRGQTIVSDIKTSHKVYNEELQQVGLSDFSMEKDESNGTKKFFYISGPILDVLENGYTLVVDELDSKLHPNLVRKIVSLFNSKEYNKKNAQLIFNTHNTNLLSSKLLRRDQIWFTDKDRYGASKLYSLADVKNVRKNEAFEDNYILGKYGATPYLGDFHEII